MRTPILVPLGLCTSLLAGVCAAQTPIRLDQTVSGTITSASPKADDGTPYDLYLYQGKAGERLRITMTSDAFDAYLAVGAVAAPACQEGCVTNDDGGGGTNAAMTVTVPAGGDLQIRANTIGASDTGAYSLAVVAAPAPARVTLRPVTLNRSMTGALGERSPRGDDDLPFDVWSVKGRAGQAVTIRLNADAFDPMVAFGSWSDGQFLQALSDDDSGPGSNARLQATLDERGEGAVKVVGYSADSSGDYTLAVGDPPAPRPIKVQDAVIGESIRGRLDDTDPVTPEEEVAFDVYTIKGRPGQRVTVQMESAAFDPVLRWGVFEGDTLLQDTSDDDSGGGTSAKLTVTLDEDGIGRLVATSLDATPGVYTLSLVGAARIPDAR
jgi:hypothetical protein